MAFGASAELIDITPGGYNFAADPTLPNVDGIAQGSPVWNPPVFWLNEHEDFYNDGCIFWIGNFGNYDDVMESIGIVDLGGEIGRVFYVNRPGSNINEALKAVIKDREVTIPEGKCGDYLIPLWHCNPEAASGDAGIRVRMVINIYQNEMQMTGDPSQFQPYFQTASNSNGEPADNTSTGKMVFSGDFALRWGEVESEDGTISWNSDLDENPNYTEDVAVYDGDGDPVWNPNRWMVYEFDIDHGAGDAPWKIKMELPGGTSAGATLFIKEMKFYAKDGEEVGIEPGTRQKSWVYYDYNKSDAIHGITADKAQGLSVSVNGNEVSFGEAAAVYSVAGTLVAQGQNVTLEKGFYVATANGKSVKFAVK